jgi:proline iminopeptidase
MSHLYPESEPYEQGLLAVGGGDAVYWETCGNPRGKPAVVLHGGPGSACTTAFRRLFDQRAYRLILLDQRNCGRSRPHASDPSTDLAGNTTSSLIADLELLRGHLGIDRWLVLGGSWGCTLALAYAQSHPTRVTELVLFGITTGRRAEFDWTFRGGLARFFPQQWERLLAAAQVPAGSDVVEIYHRLVNDEDADVRQRAATEWCMWESATPDWPPATGLAERFRDPEYALAFARIVTHYVRHNAWLEDGAILRGANVLARTPAVLVHGRFDFQAPLANAWELRRAWPGAELVVVDDAGHGGSAALDRELIRATDRFARAQR